MSELSGPDTENPGYEERDVNLTKLVSLTIATIVLLIVILVALNEFFLSSKEQRIYEAFLRPESAALRDLRATEDEALNSYKLLDKDKGIYQIPIERAIELVAREAYRER